MKHLVKKAASFEDSFSIIGSWSVLAYHHGEDQDDDYNYVDEEEDMSPGMLTEDLLEKAIEFAEDDFDSAKSIIMEQMQEKCQDDEKVVDIKFELDMDESYMHVYCNQAFSEETKKEILNIVEGQYSDGWGEGLEQRIFASEDALDYGSGVKSDYYVNLWPYDVKFRIG